MTSTEIVVLHSSPPHQQRENETTVTTPTGLQYVPNSSASGDSTLPSISKLWTKWDPKLKDGIVSPLVLDERLKGGSRVSPLPRSGSLGFQSVREIVGRKEFTIEKEVVEIQAGTSKSGMAKIGDETKPKRAKTKSKADQDGMITEAKPKAKKKSKAKTATESEDATASSHFGQIEKSGDTLKEAKPNAKRKSRAKTVVSNHFDKTTGFEEKDASKPIEKKTAPATKKRKRKDADCDEKKLEVVKRASKETEAQAEKPRKKTGKASVHFGSGDLPKGGKDKDVETVTSAVSGITEPMDLAEKRRRSWTPAKDTAQFKPEGQNIYEVPSSSQPPSPIGTKTDFQSLIGSFGFNGTPTTRGASPEKVSVVGVNKRRRIELIADTTLVPTESKTDAPRPAAPKAAVTKEAKKKSPKKAAFSITAKVTAKYRQPAIVAAETTSAFFDARVETPLNDASPKKKASPVKKAPKARPKGPTKPRAPRKAPEEGGNVTKSKAKVTKPKKVVRGGQKLISPSGIASRAQQQVVMFGTSSQLLTGDSPQTLRHLQQALRESELMTIDQKEPTSTAPVQRRLARGIRHTSGKMWAQQAESFEEDTAKAEEIKVPNIVGAPELPPIAEELEEAPDLPPINAKAVASMLHHFTDDGFQTLSDEIGGMESLDPLEETESPTIGQPDAGGFIQGQQMLAEEEDTGWNEISSPLALPTEQERTEWKTISSPSVPPAEIHRIDTRQSPSPATRTIMLSSKRTATTPAMRSSLFIPFVSFTDRTALRPLSTNTKSPKKTTTMIKDTAKSTSLVTAKSTASPKRKRGRPPKAKGPDEGVKDNPSKSILPLQSTPIKARKEQDTADGWHNIDDIEDSDPDMTPSPRRRGKKAPPSPLPDLATTATEAVTKRADGVLANANHPQWPEIQAKLFPDITLAVKGQARSSGGQKLTWYEKMLLYDPIVIEDLTAFVNTEGLRIVVKEKGEEVRGWMVQKWCEENSVCCLWKEGLRGGVKTKY